MTRVSEFDTFYDSTRGHILHLTYAVCGDRHAASSASQEAYRHTWQHWTRLRAQDPVQYVRREAARLAAFSVGAHPWRRRHEDDSDAELLKALKELPLTSRRLLVLQTLGELDLDAAAGDVGLTEQAALVQTRAALADLEDALTAGLDHIEARLVALGAITRRVAMPRPPAIRRQSRRRSRRRTAVLVAAACGAVVAAGLGVTEGGPFQQAEAQVSREQIRPPASPGPKFTATEGQLLDADQVSRLNPAQNWSVAVTDVSGTASPSGRSEDKPYAMCAETRFADARLTAGYVRRFKSSGGHRETALQALEVSRNAKAAARTQERMKRWYADCASARTQLAGTYSSNGITILRLRSFTEPVRTVSVGIIRTGVITSALVHEVDGRKGPPIAEFAQAVSDSASMVCADGGGGCRSDATVSPRLPLPAGNDPAFLNIVDLPPVTGVDRVWAGTRSTRADSNPASTVCDKADFTGAAVREARARIFVIPQERQIPEEFGIAETVARFGSPATAQAFVATVGRRIEACADKNLSASLDESTAVSGRNVAGRTWRLAFEVDRDNEIYYRTSIVRRGPTVAQVTLSPAKRYDVSRVAFEQLAVRAGERLAYLR
ncbi:MAG: hypothetical protein H0V59_00855 [Nocardioidaceae bacterium]|nr:hypothetical protein [Nocardioidaceae bacterium]